MSKAYKAILGFCFMAGVLMFIPGCGQHDESSVIAAAPVADTGDMHRINIYNNHLVDSAVSLLRSGDIVVRSGSGADSHILMQMNLKDKTYSHCGIVMVEHGYPFVYHSIGGEDNPDERLRRDSARFFFSPLHNFGFGIVRYDFPAERMDTLQQIVRRYYAGRPRFDMKFDLKTDDCLYCAEFIYKAVNKAMDDTGYIKTSYAMGYTFVGIDDLFLNSHAHPVWQVVFK